MGRFELLHCKCGELEINESTASVKLAGVAIELPKLSYQLLLTLIRNAPAVVSQQQLIEEVWLNKVISDDTIQQRIKLLRQALGDNPKAPTYIATIRGQGYQLVQDIEHINNKEKTKTKQSIIRNSLVASTVLITALVIWLNFSNKNGSLSKSANPQAEETVTNFDASKHSKIEAARNFYFNGKDYLNRRTEESNRAALIQFEKAIELDPSYALAYTGVAHVSVERYQHFSKEPEALKVAEQAALQAISLRPNIYETHHALAVSYHTAQRTADAKNAYRKVISLHPNHSQSLNNLSYLERLDGNYHEALTLAYHQVKAAPRKPLPYIQVAESYIKFGYHDLAILWYQQALKFEPQRRYTQFSICRLHIKLKNLDAASKSCKDMVDWAPDDAWGYEWVGHLALLKGEREKAITNYHEAMELDSNYSKFRYPSLVLDDPGQDPIQLKLWMDEAHTKMLAYIEESPDSIGDILNICDYYAVTKNKEQLLFWMRKLLDMKFTDFYAFTYADIYDHYHNDSDFLELYKQLKSKQLELKNSIDKALIISPQQFKDLNVSLIN